MTDNLWGLDEDTRSDLRLLLATLREYAGYVLLDCPVFKPFGASLDNNGKVGLAVAQLEGKPELDAYRQALLLGFRKMAERGEIRAAGYCQKGREGTSGRDEVEVIWICLEHRAGMSGKVSMTFSVDGPEKVTFGESFIQRDERRIFGTSDDPGLPQSP
jgi:hypothetical protein